MRLERTTLEVSPISMGTGGFGTDIKGDAIDRLLEVYFELGGNLLDTAHIYGSWVPGGDGASERAIGDWIRRTGMRDKVLISTKGGHPPISWYPHSEDFLSEKAILQDLEESLDRLRTDRIDLYYLHRDDGFTPVDEIIERLNALPSVSYLGASNWSVGRVAEANRYAAATGKRGFVTLQSQWSLAIPTWAPTEDPSMRFIQDIDCEWCYANKVAIHAYSSTANGFFASDAEFSSFAGNDKRRLRAKELAQNLGKTANQVALAWLLNQDVQALPLIGTTKIDHMKDAFGALDIVLEVETLDWLRA